MSITDIIAWQQVLRASKDAERAASAANELARIAEYWRNNYYEFGELTHSDEGVPIIVYHGARSYAAKKYPNAAQGNRDYKRRYNLTVYVAAEALWHLHASDINALRDPKARKAVAEFLRALDERGVEGILTRMMVAMKRRSREDVQYLNELASRVITKEEVEELRKKGLDEEQIMEIALGRIMKQEVRSEKSLLAALDKLGARGWLALTRITRSVLDRYAAYGFDEELSKRKFKQLVDERFEQLWNALEKIPNGWVGPTKTYPNVKALPVKLRIPSWHVAEKIRGPIQEVDVGGFQKLYEQ